MYYWHHAQAPIICYTTAMIGIDEVGRGCWAGPLLVVATRQVADLPTSLADSKVLSKKKRETLFYEIALCCDIGEGWVQPKEIDDLGLTKAMYLAVQRALLALGAMPDEKIIMDGNINYCPSLYLNAEAVIDADATHPVVSAASIYAKVLRDKYMAELAPEYAKYQFGKHVGYGTKLHSEMLKVHGVCDLHRLSYKPIQSILISTGL
jgi:ribonuclease HII